MPPENPAPSETACPFAMNSVKFRHTAEGAQKNSDWWPNQLRLDILRQNPPAASPMPADFDYAEAFKTLDFKALKADLLALMTDSQDWWPADYGHYGGFFVRMAWHAAGTYRVADGRGGAGSGMLRFAPLNSWPDNANLDKARRLLWPIKQKYGEKISWADLLVLTGNVAIESMGLPTSGFGGGREDKWTPEQDIFWGPESEWLGDERYKGDRELQGPLGAVQMGLIYVNPEGPNGKPDPKAAAHDIRETFGRMAMNDEETVALIAGGHTFGKSHGAADPEQYVGPEPEAAPLEEQALGWKNSFGKGHSEDTITSGLEGAWTQEPTKWDNGYFENLFKYDWELTKSPAGGHQWKPVAGQDIGEVRDAHVEGKSHEIMMFTTDLALKEDPVYGPISRRFYENPQEFAVAFSKAWYKLTHRDMGPLERYLGPEVPAEPELWQDPLPTATHDLIDDADVAALKQRLLNAGVPLHRLVATAWDSAASFRHTDMRGGANGARIRLDPMRNWASHEPEALSNTLQTLAQVRAAFNETLHGDKQVSLADVIVLGGCAAVEAAAKAAGQPLTVPFTPGRVDADASQMDAESFACMEPLADGFRNFYSKDADRPGEEMLVDRAHLLGLTAPEMTVLVGGMRALDTNHGGSKAGVLTDRPGQLNNDFFVNLLDNRLTWKKSAYCDHVYEGRTQADGEPKWTGTAVDLVFGSNSELRALSEVYASADAGDRFVHDFVAAWDKVMNADRFDLHR